ncbi:MAG: hypothetical protein Q9162_005343 [Coniocarpon cinnabarinum]
MVVKSVLAAPRLPLKPDSHDVGYQRADELSLLLWSREEQAFQPETSRQYHEWTIDSFPSHSRITKTPPSSTLPSQFFDVFANLDVDLFSRPARKPARKMARVPGWRRRRLRNNHVVSASPPSPSVEQPLQTHAQPKEPCIESVNEKLASSEIVFQDDPAAAKPTTVKLATNGARLRFGHAHSKNLPALPPPREVQGPEQPPTHFCKLPWEVREPILEYVFDSALVIMSTTENFGRYIMHRATACRSRDEGNSIPADVFPCLGYNDRRGRYHLALADRLFGEPLHCRNLPYARRKKIEKGDLHERNIGASLLFVNKQLAEEFAPIVYSRTAFAFGSSVAVRKFLDVQDKLADRRVILSSCREKES